MIKVISNGIEMQFDRLQFSGGELHVRLHGGCYSGKPATILAHMRSPADLIELLLITDALRRVGCRAISLRIPYLPYARQDRVCVDGEALSLKVMCDMLNSQRYESVEVWDVHSDTSLALIDRVRHIDVSVFLAKTGEFSAPRTVLVAPDAGSLKKVMAVSEKLQMPFIRADKTRDPATGKISGTTVYGDHIGDKDFLIIDDICDGGRTFIELSKKLRPLTNGAVMLYVTHGIFSAGTAVFDGLIDKVIVANSFVEQLPNNFHLIKD